MKKIITKLELSALFCGVCLFFSCSNSTEDSINKSEDKQTDSTDYEIVEQDLQEEQRAKIEIIEKKGVVFFMISKKEMKEVMQEIGDSYRWETEALFNNFNTQVATFQSLLKRHNLNCVLSHNKQFEIKLKNGKVVSFDRIKEDQIIGEIITDGVQEPLIEYGMFTNKELADKLEDYFKIENLGYVPDSVEKAEEEKINTP